MSPSKPKAKAGKKTPSVKRVHAAKPARKPATKRRGSSAPAAPSAPPSTTAFERCPECGFELALGVLTGGPTRRTTYAHEPEKDFRFTRERRSALLLLLRAMVSHARACELLQCSEDTPRDWHKAGRAALVRQTMGEQLDERAKEQVEFARLYEDALTFAEANLVGRVQKGSEHDWRAAAWLLSVKKPAEYSERWKVRELQIQAEAPVREAERRGKEADAQISEEKLAQIKEARQNGGQVLVLGADELIDWLTTTDELPAETRESIVVVLNKSGFKFVEARDLGGPSHVPGGG